MGCFVDNKVCWAEVELFFLSKHYKFKYHLDFTPTFHLIETLKV